MAELEFRKPEITDRGWAEKLLHESGFRGCLYTFGNNYVWSEEYDVGICRYKDFYLLMNHDHSSTPRFLFPAGSGDIPGLISALREYCTGAGIPLKMTANRECTGLLRSLYPDIIAEPDRDGFDYVYNSTDLAELKGKRYHSKRNHLNRFYENDWRYEEISRSNIGYCTEVLESWLGSSGQEDPEKQAEARVVRLSLDKYFELGYSGGLIFAGGEPQAFTFGEPSAADTFVVHAEKALLNYQGAYTAINCEFSKTLADRFRFINREEDAGSDGLRKAKLSYHPAFLEEKYFITFGGMT